MAAITVYNASGEKTGSIDIDPTKLDIAVRRALLKEALIAHLASQRQGSHKNKDRGEVAGGGRKPWKQKGTGRARQGSNTSPLMPGGGRAFGPRPRDYRTELPKKSRHAALVSALSLKATENAVSVLEGLQMDAPKTSKVVGVLKNMGLSDKKTLLVVAQQNEAVWKSVRNIGRLETTLAHQLNAYDLLHAEALVMTQEGLEKVKEVFAK